MRVRAWTRTKPHLAGRFALAVGHLRDDELEIRRVGSTHWKRADMEEAYLLHASLRATNSLGTDLTGAFGVTWDQIQTPRRDHNTRFPASINVPRPQK